MVDDHNAVLFGGSGQGGVRYNDVYTLDLERMVSCELLTPNECTHGLITLLEIYGL